MSPTPEIRWPQSLKSAASAEELARALYQARCQFYDTAEQPWEEVPYHLRAGLFELALRTLRHLGVPLSEVVEGQTDPIFHLASELARSEARRVVGRITPAEPFGVSRND